MDSLKLFRQKNNMTQKEVASFLNLSQQAYASYENSDRIPSHKLLLKLAELFKVSINELTSNIDVESEMIEDSIEEYLSKSYTAFHATKNAESILIDNGFVRLYDFEKWDLKPNGKYYLLKNSSSLIAFKIGYLSNYSINIAEAHTDSPCLKIKGKELLKTSEGYAINVEKYGGLILYSFMDIPLKIAGRLIIKDNDKIVTKIVTSSFNVSIPSLCIHHNGGVNTNFSPNVQVDMLPLLGDCSDLYKALSSDSEIIDADLYVVPDIKPFYTGVNKEFLCSPRIDNLTSAYSVIKGITSANVKGVAIGCIFDNEEIGSMTKQGARSEFLEDTIYRINNALNKTKEELLFAIANGLTLSIDNGHAVHYAHPEKSDILEKVYMNKGIVIKHHTNYATDGLSSSLLKSICDKEKIPYQDYYNRSDINCGGTIGLMTSTKLEMNTCDIGLAQLAMHSAIETVGKYDIERMTKLVSTFFDTRIIAEKNDTYTIE